VRASPQTLAVLDSLLQNCGAWTYGYDLSKLTGLKSGTLYPILQRLNSAGWLETKWEQSGEPGRPPRHLYRLSREGKIAARQFASQKSNTSTALVAYES
jgi:PadR family transcriptional regulator, regulatory protein PadR